VSSTLPIDRSHHATLIEGDFVSIREDLIASLERIFNIKALHNPDFQIRSYETLGVEEARELKSQAGYRAVRESTKIFLISFSAIGTEAQNALLKLFEEPAPNTFFVLVGKVGTRILPTLRSRLNVIAAVSVAADVREAKKFLEKNGAERLEMLKGIIEDRDREQANLLLNGLEEELHSSKKIAENVRSLSEISIARRYLADRSSSVKLLLEHLSIVLPQV